MQENNDDSIVTTFECSQASWAARLGCILSYNHGSWVDIVINYGLLLLNLAVVVAYFVPPHKKTMSGLALIFVVAFQIVLCMILFCSGISIIWCAVAGWIMFMWGKTTTTTTSRRLLIIIIMCILSLDGMALAYYAVTAEGITTVAHVCAIVLGAILAWMVHMVHQKHRSPMEQEESSSISTSSSSTPLMGTGETQ